MSKSNGKKKASDLRNLIKDWPNLSKYERCLLIEIDVEGKTITEVAKSLGKAKSTVSSQHKKALEKLQSMG